MISLKGDLSQMYTQMSYLERCGFRVMIQGGVPFVEQNDYSEVLKLIYTSYVEGWWNYKDDFMQNGICTETEFIARL